MCVYVRARVHVLVYESVYMSACMLCTHRAHQHTGMTLHYSRARMDASSPVHDAVPARTRPATAGVGRDLVPGGMQFFDAVTGQPLGGATRQRPVTARGDLGRAGLSQQGTPKLGLSHGLSVAGRCAWSGHDSIAEMDPAIEFEDVGIDGYGSTLRDADIEVEQMIVAERYSVAFTLALSHLACSVTLGSSRTHTPWINSNVCGWQCQ